MLSEFGRYKSNHVGECPKFGCTGTPPLGIGGVANWLTD